MEINNVKAMEGTSGGQNTKAQPVDSISKNIQNEISDVQRKRQELSSKEDIPVEEKQKKRREMQQEISRLNTQLRQRQAEMRREKQKELLSEEMKTDPDKTKEEEAKKVETKEAGQTGKDGREIREEEKKGTEEENKAIGISGTGMQETVAADLAMRQLRSRQSVISGMENGIAILQGEIRQDEARGANVEQKQAALKKQEEKVQKASAPRFSVLDNTYKVIVDATRANTGGSKETAVNNVKRNSDANAFIKSSNYTKENKQSPQPFYTSFHLYG